MASGSGSGAAGFTRQALSAAPIAGAANCSMAPANRSTESMSRPTGCHDRRWEAEIAARRNVERDDGALASGGVNIRGELLGERTIAPPPSFRFRRGVLAPALLQIVLVVVNLVFQFLDRLLLLEILAFQQRLSDGRFAAGCK